MSKKPLGRSSGSLNAPIAAFTMAVVLCAYCIYSINSARRDAHGQAMGTAEVLMQAKRRQQQDDWVKDVLEERERKGLLGISNRG
ncbi:hypothetical protein BDW68DRAFT_32358 [Aspergillus falconensis]